MPLKRFCLATLATILWAGTLASAHAAVGMESLPESIREVNDAPVSGPMEPHRPYIMRRSLQATETEADIEFEIALKMRNYAELQARLAKGERISGDEMTTRYDPLAANYLTVVDWLIGQGFTITLRDPGHMVIFARGKVSEIQTRLNVSFARVSLDGREYTSAITAPSVPSTWAPFILGINGLQPHIHAHKHLIQRQLNPNASSGNAAYFPNQIAQAYNATGMYNANVNGSGQAIAIVIDTFPATSDLISFWSAAKINQSLSNVQFIQVVSGTLPSPSGEETLDTEWSSSIAPGANVRVYAIADSSLPDSKLDQAYQSVLNDATNHPELGIHQMSMSYGGPEADTPHTQLQTDDQFFSKLTVAGVTIFASSGDGGSTPSATQGGDSSYKLEVETPASDPNVTGVGGTSLKLDSNNNETSETVWNNPGSNNTNGTINPATAGGGGISSFFAEPSYQMNAGISGTKREVPDISATADPNFGAIVYLNGATNLVYGGTSWSSPTCAGFCALLNEARSNAGLTTIGPLNPLIYPLLGSGNFRDIVSGNNILSGAGTTTAMSHSGGNKYSASTGYDPASGIGAPLVQTLAQTLVGGTAPTITTQPVSQVVAIGQPVSFSVTASGTASLSYQWFLNGVSINGATGSTYTIPSVASGNAGDYTVTITNIYGSLNSSSATLIPIASQPMAETVTSGQSATFSVGAATPGYSYQWLFNGTPIPGATSSSYTISPVSSANAGNYSVTVSDSNGTATTAPVALIVSPLLAGEPTMPQWMLIVLAGALVCFASGQKSRARA